MGFELVDTDDRPMSMGPCAWPGCESTATHYAYRIATLWTWFQSIICFEHEELLMSVADRG